MLGFVINPNYGNDDDFETYASIYIFGFGGPFIRNINTLTKMDPLKTHLITKDIDTYFSRKNIIIHQCNEIIIKGEK